MYHTYFKHGRDLYISIQYVPLPKHEATGDLRSGTNAPVHDTEYDDISLLLFVTGEFLFLSSNE